MPLEEAAKRRKLTAQEAEDHSRLTTMLDVVTRRLGIEPTPRRRQAPEAEETAEEQAGAMASAWTLV